MKFKLLVMALSWMEGGGVRYNFESGPTKDHFSLCFSTEDFNVI